MSVLQILIYAAVLVFLVANFTRFVRMKATPIHLRWELYPVAHDFKRFKYGGSFLEESDWHGKETHKSLIGEMRVMLPEIFFLKGVWEHNRGLWLWSYPFHVGLYLLSVLIVVLIVSGFAIGEQINGGYDNLGAFGKILYNLSYYMLAVGCVIGIIGSIGLFFRRAFDREMSANSAFGSYFNIIFIGLIFASGLALIISGDAVEKLVKFYYSLVNFKGLTNLGAAMTVHALISALFILYLPFTHMTHFFMKWFTYHEVRWEDTPNRPGGAMDKKLQKQLAYPVSWAAPHIKGDGKKSWVEIVTEEGKTDE